MPAPVARARRTLAAVAIAALAMAMAGCGSSTPKLPAAGHDTPEAAAVGFLSAASAGNGGAACGYVLPSQTAVCTSAFTSGGALSVQELGIGHTTVAGDRALVTVLGKLCTGVSNPTCFTSKDPAAGQPTGTTTFDAAYTQVEAGTASDPNDPAVPCQRAQGAWYVDLGQSSSGASSSPSQSSPTS